MCERFEQVLDKSGVKGVRHRERALWYADDALVAAERGDYETFKANRAVVTWGGKATVTCRGASVRLVEWVLYIPTAALLWLVSAKWLTITQYITTRLSQLEWELTHPIVFLQQAHKWYFEEAPNLALSCGTTLPWPI